MFGSSRQARVLRVGLFPPWWCRGPESLLGSPRRPQGHPIVPRGSHDPPGRPFGHPCGTVFEHFAHNFGACGTSFATKSVRDSPLPPFTLSTDRKLSLHRISYSYRPHIRSKGAAARGTQVCHTRCLTFYTFIRPKFVLGCVGLK